VSLWQPVGSSSCSRQRLAAALGAARQTRRPEGGG
jgi:hypothetical protein